MTKPNELREILDSLYISSKEGSATHEHPSTLLFIAGKDEAEAAILKFVDEVIGQKTSHGSKCLKYMGGFCDCGYAEREKLRAEQRRRAGLK